MSGPDTTRSAQPRKTDYPADLRLFADHLPENGSTRPVPPGGPTPTAQCAVADEEVCGVYAWMWHHLPGAAWVKVIWVMVIFTLVVFVLFQYIFPAVEPYVPFSGSGSVST